MIKSYYNQLAPFYRYLFPDWEKSVFWHAEVLDGVIREYFGSDVSAILDAACGIGTQSLGLAQLGYHLTASDISFTELAMARDEADKRSLSLQFVLADMRELGQVLRSKFDLVIACDNAIPHLLSEADILLAFQQFFDCTTEKGGCIISVRDYANMDLGGRRIYPRIIHSTPQGRLILLDIWEFDGVYYDFTTYVVEDQGAPVAQTHIARGGRYFCVTISALEGLLKQAGFRRVKVLRGIYHQPILVGMKTDF